MLAHLQENVATQLYGRYLDHGRPISAPRNGPAGQRAGKTEEGYCIEYRESLKEHYDRYMAIWETKPISYFAIGMTRGLQFAAFSLQADEGDCHWEEPTVLNFAKHEIWRNWQAMRGMAQETAQRESSFGKPI